MPRRTAMVLLGVVSALAVGLGTADAEPPFTPDLDDIVGVGSDTTQGVIDELARQYPAYGNRRLASFDAFPTGSTVVIRDPDQIPGNGDEIVIGRPSGSSAGITALCSNIGQYLDFARSSRPADGSTCQSALTFIPFARDGLSYVVDDLSLVPTNLTASDLRDIYTCQLPGYEPKLPQAGSGTRSNFLQQIGVTEAQIAVSDCVDANVQGNDTAAVDGNPFALMPMSVAAYRTNPDGVVLASDVDPGAFLVYRDVFNVVKNSSLNDPGIQYYFGPNGVLCQLMADGELGLESIGTRCGT